MAMEEYRFPMFLDLNGKKAVVIGGGKIGLRRAGVLADFGAQVTLIAPECQQCPSGVKYLPRSYQPGDLQGAFLAVAATDNRMVNQAIGEEARQHGIFVSVADRKEESSFFFPAVCSGNGLVAGVVSRGQDHRKTAEAAKIIRSALEGMQ